MKSLNDQINDEIDGRLQALLNLLKPVETLDPDIMADARARYLEQVNNLGVGISRQPDNRLTGWINKITHPTQQKVLSPMYKALLTLAVMIGILFGGLGTTVYAAQNSLPDQSLYPVKAWSEQVRLRFTNTHQEQLGMVLQFTHRRMLELSELVSEDKAIPLQWQTRFAQNLEDALLIAAEMDDSEMQEALGQIRYQAENQVQNIMAVRREHPGLAEPLLAQVQERLHEQAQLAGIGESDPQGFREQIRDRDRIHWTITPLPDATATCEQTPECTPIGTQNSYGPGPNEGPLQGTQAQFGPLPGVGTASGTQAQFGPGGSEQTPAPTGTSYGSGPLNPSATPQPGGQGTAPGQPTPAPIQNGDPDGGNATQSPGKGKP